MRGILVLVNEGDISRILGSSNDKRVLMRGIRGIREF